MREVVGHLVDEKRCALALNTSSIQIFLAQFLALFTGQIYQTLWILGFVGSIALSTQASRQNNNFPQLRRAINLGMAREDLFKQSRAGSGQADNKDRIGGLEHRLNRWF